MTANFLNVAETQFDNNDKLLNVPIRMHILKVPVAYTH
jgi:hypothetical protein